MSSYKNEESNVCPQQVQPALPIVTPQPGQKYSPIEYSLTS